MQPTSAPYSNNFQRGGVALFARKVNGAQGLLQVLPAGEVQPHKLLLTLEVGQQGVVGLLQH